MKRFLKPIRRCLTDPDYRWLIRANRGRFDGMPDETYLRRRYRAILGREPELERPQGFNEKLQWLKLHDRDPLYPRLADKYLVREYVAARIGAEHLIPLLGVWDAPEEIDFDALPRQFVLKCNHNSGLGMYICRDKSRLTAAKRRAIRRALRCGLAQDYFAPTREWPYRDIPRKIIAEQYLTDIGGQLSDYKLHCFDGEPQLILVCRDRFSAGGLTEDFFDTDWTHLELRRPGRPNAAEPIEKPACLDEMLRLSRRLSAGIPFLRVDLYVVGGRIYFGELTFFPMSGFGKFDPPAWDRRLGALLRLPGEAAP